MPCRDVTIIVLFRLCDIRYSSATKTFSARIMERDDATTPAVRVPGTKVVKGVTSFTLYLLDGAAKQVR